MAVAADQEFGEIPFDFFRKEARCLFDQMTKQRMGIVSFNVHFFEEGKGGPVCQLAMICDMCIGKRFLVQKLAAWKGKHFKFLVLKSFVQGFQTSQLGSEAAAACRIDDKQDMVFVC